MIPRNTRSRCAAIAFAAMLWACPPFASASDAQTPSSDSGCEGKLQSQALHDREWFEPVVADPRSPKISFDFPVVSDPFEFSLKPGRRLVWDVSVGKEIPLIVFEKAPDANSAWCKGDWGFGLWVAVSFHVVEDMFKDPSNPIVNTDYRFSLATLKYRRALRVDQTNLKNTDFLDIKADLLHHESTHLGDEFVIGAIREFGDRFERINVSYEFWDIAGSWEATRAASNGGKHGWTLRGGLLAPWYWSNGYYSDHTLETDSRVIATSKRNLEPYGQVEYWWPHASVKGVNQRTWAPFVSTDVRWKMIYDYHKASSDQPEDRQFSGNLLLGIRTDRQASLLSVREIYARFYHGVNPAGQLRNQRDYTMYGIGLNFAVGSRP